MDSGVKFRVTGRVQGVAFRAFVQGTGTQMGLAGWVKNNSDGSVHGYAEGDQGMLIAFMKQVRIGNRWSDVHSLDQESVPFSGEFDSFEIRD
ncbi:MAG: acylphosphatase [Candidatus Marinimicrobia bacterium]|nr:acylphosphatase [Candidatus Neomarinimicrobiota bacterium]MCF7904865.1 acylphosphatase [Candidatus Neomarinimicrobiota bacterium]